MSDKVRVRFAPSPTGHLHIGGLRAAIFNWLFARNNNGKFLVRIEDTDIERSKPEYQQSILDSLEWIGITPDEPILIQSSRFDEHKKLIQKLIDEGKAYRCFCPQADAEGPHKYPGTCRNLKVTEEDLKRPFVVRFKLPDLKNESIAFNDLIHGEISFPLDQLDDFIIARSDGTPMYNFVVVADDAYMGITHILRGDEHLNNTPKQILLYRALGYNLPKFGHLPLILNEDGKKLSKRDAAISAIEYKKAGYLPEALFNYLVRLGWSHGDQEIFNREELVKYFTLDSVGKSGAVFDIKKLDWLNSVYLKQKEAKELFELIKTIDSDFDNKLNNLNREQVYALLDLYKERVKTLVELEKNIIDISKVPENYDQESTSKWTDNNTANYLEKLVQKLQELENWDEVKLSETIKALCKELNIKLPQLAQPIRIALTGSDTSPSVFLLLDILGKQQSIERITIFKSYIS